MDAGPLNTVRVDVSDRIATITLNRPDRLNAYTPEMGTELFGALHRARRRRRRARSS